MDFEPFVDADAVAEFMGISRRQVMTMSRRGELPAHPIGRGRKTWRYRISEVAVHFSTVRKPVRGTTNTAVPVATMKGT
jgi:hypothetical protein